ncbi:MAG: hypothetical protein JXX14_24045 [Deltaproteobacteria bacterium]|nr:hypothetical protein [Deltaproteobacteria bacterium]
MKQQKRIQKTLVIVLTVILAGFLSGGACDDGGPLDNIAEQCGLSCPGASEGLVAGNASITGVASIDGFFGSVVNFNTKATKVSADIDAALKAIYGSVGLDVAGKAGADLDMSAQFQAALAAKFYLDASAGAAIKVEYQKPKCEVSASASIEATAKCDVEVQPGSVEASCSGKCEVDPGEVNLEAACEGSVEAELTCTGTAPSLSCEGSCTGGCELEVAATCEGTCNGSCTGTCSVENTDGSCAGECDGECEGTCEMEAGGSCSGKCTGSCEYTPASGSCEGGAKAEVSCKAEANAEPPQVNCSGSCSGEVTPPSASAECEASAKAEAELSAECTPPSIGVSYSFDASLVAAAEADGSIESEAALKAEFKAWLTLFKTEVGNLVAAMAQADIVLKAGEGMISAAGNVIGKAGAELAADADFSVAFKLGCLPAELKKVPGIIGDASDKLSGSVDASVSLVGIIKK